MGVSQNWGQATAVSLLAPVVIATDTTTLTSALDLSLYRKVKILVHAGVATDGTYTPILQTSDATGGTYADDDAILDAWTVITTSTDDQIYAVDLDLDKADERFAKIEITSASTTSGALLAVTAVCELKAV